MSKGESGGEMQQSRDFMEKIFNMTGDGLYVTDEVGTIVRANQALCELTGYRTDELEGMPAIDLGVDPAVTDISPSELESVYTRDYSNYYANLYQRKDGSVFPVETKITNFPGSAALIVSVRDITERQQAEQSLRESEDRLAKSRDFLESIFNATGDGIYVTDEMGYIVRASRALCAMTGFAEEELIGKYGADLSPVPGAPELEAAVWDGISLDYEDFFKRFYQKESAVFEYYFLKKDGTILPVELSIRNVRDAAASGTAIIVSARDITDRRQAERALKESEVFLENVFSLTGDGIYVTDEQGTIIRANRALCEMEGYTEAELVGRPSFSLIAELPGDALPRRTGQRFESLHQRKDGSVFPVETKITDFEIRSGSRAVIVSVRDISERMQAEAAIKESEVFLENIFNMTGDGMYVTDEVGTIVRANRALGDMLGYAEAELTGKPSIDLTPELFGSAEEEIMAQEMFSMDYSRNFESLHQRKDGSVLPVEAKITNFPDSAALIVSVRDITERKQAERALKESEERFRSVVETAQDAIVTVNRQGEIVFWNNGAEMLYGYAAAEVLGKPFTVMIPPRLHSTQQRGLASLLASEGIALSRRTSEGLAYTKDGREIAIENSVSAWRSGDEIYITIINRDATERKQAEKQLKQAHDELEQKVQERTISLGEANTALRVLLKGQDRERVALEEKMVANVNELIMPYVAKVKESRMTDQQRVYLEVVESNLNDIISPFARSTKLSKLTPTEIKVANLIKMGKNTKEIADLAHLSPRTVEGHRDRIRQKIGIKNQKINLRTYLLALE
ncbi:PAS domain S-box protein [Thermodesulfobacteriota bacterium]